MSTPACCHMTPGFKKYFKDRIIDPIENNVTEYYSRSIENIQRIDAVTRL